MESPFDLTRIKTMNLKLNAVLKESLLSENSMDIADFNQRTAGLRAPSMKLKLQNGERGYENPFVFSFDILRNINNYRFVYKNPLKQVYDYYKLEDPKTKEKSKPYHVTTNQAVTSSLFNPLYNVQICGMADNVPLLNDYDGIESQMETDLGDCSIKELVRLSNSYNSILGMARYRYADFMYCKDLGKVANNHLITLRKFPFPVGDHIFKFSGPRYRNGSSKASTGDFDTTGDIGRLVTWFGTEDNKLEDILKYDYAATWKELNSKIQEIDSKEDSEKRGSLGMVFNTFNPEYNAYAAGGFTGTQNLLRGLGARFQGPSDNMEVLRNYDNNKVYEPKNTVQDTHIYEGKLKFNQEFTLVFSYKMRSYDNINQKSAFLDLIANILEVTYKRGSFWGGRQKIVGPPPNKQGWQKANAFIDNAFDKLGGYLNALADGSMNLGDVLGKLADGAQELLGKAKEQAKNALGNLGGSADEITKNVADKVKTLNDKYGIGQAIKGSLKNALGRPAMYAFDSLLPSGVSGLWHVTIGNPKNPIVAFGNLIMTKAVVQHLGPLGIDDFPTEIKVSVTLKHAKSRDLTSIAKMYTRGISDIYLSNARTSLANWYHMPNAASLSALKTFESHLKDASNAAGKMAAAADSKKKLESDASAGGFDYELETAALNLNIAGKQVVPLDNHLINPENAFLASTGFDRFSTLRVTNDELG